MKKIIELYNISKAFQTEEIKTLALRDINLTIHSGEYVALSGPSGCGKSTLLSILGLLDTPSTGQYLLSGNDVSSLSRDQRADIRSQSIGFVFQSFNLISDLTVEENVLLPLTYQSNVSRHDAKQKAKEVLAQVEMSHRLKHFPSQLSGGQQQRVAIARALINSPAIVLADEPTGNLDSNNAEIVMGLFDQLHRAGKTICMVTHDPRSASYASRQIDLFDGKQIGDSATAHSIRAEKKPVQLSEV